MTPISAPYKHISSKNILEIRSNIKNLLGFKYGCEYTNNNDNNKSKIVLYYQSTKLNTIKPKGRQILLTRPLSFLPAAKALIDITDRQKFMLSVNKSYETWSNLRGTSSFARPEDILSNLATVQILLSKMTPLHCGCVDIDGNGVLLVAPSDTGKTFTTSVLVNEYGFNFVSEDIAISDGRKIYGCPYTATGIPSHKNGKEYLGSRFKLLFFPSRGAKRKLVDYIPQDKIIPQTKISHIIFLKRGFRNISPISKPEALKYLIRSNMTEFKYTTDKDLLALWNKFDYPDILQLNNIEKQILTELVQNAKEMVSIALPNPEDFAKEIKLLVEK